jgi:membrane protein DedA with SNARE-associated domain
VTDLIVRFGLLAVFLVATAEGDVILVLAGVAAHLGLLDLWLAVGAGAAGCLTGDLAWFSIGHWRSEAIRTSRFYRSVGPTIERIVHRLGPWQILTARFVYGTRVATMVFWGAHRLAPGRFAAIDLLGCALWATALGLAGYGASSGAAAILGDVKRAEIWLLGAVIASGAVLVAARRLLARRRHGA